MFSLVTWNTKKYQQIVEKLDERIISQQVDLDIPEIQTNLLTEISREKCIEAYNKVKGPVLVDDSWIYFSHYNEFPGALTKFLYKGVGMAWIKKLFSQGEDTTSVFTCVLSYMDEQLSYPVQFVGEIPGKLNFDRVNKITEDGHLPYDVIFVPENMDKPAYFYMEERKATSHRTRAVKLFNDRYLKKRI